MSTKKEPAKKPKKEKKPRPKGEWIVDYVRVSETSRPADFTLQKLTQIESMGTEQARANRLGLLDKGPNARLLSRSLWLNNNNLTSLSNLPALVNGVLEYPETLGFLDVSCNEITTIHEDLFKYPNIKILYMHGNKISDPKEIIKLRKLKKLFHLTLYGNPVRKLPELGDTRRMIATYLPTLMKLDHNRFTELDRSCPLAATAMRILREVIGEPPDWLFKKFPIPKLTPEQLAECEKKKDSPKKETPKKEENDTEGVEEERDND